MERRNLTRDLGWQEEQEAVGASRPRSTRGVPSPGATTYGRSDGVEVLAKAWHTKRLACMFEELASGNVKMSVWAVNETCRREHFFAMKKLQALLADEEPAADVADSAPAPPVDCSLVTEQEMADWTEQDKKRHREEVERFARYRRLKNSIDNTSSQVPGSWICSRCFSTNGPDGRICKNYYHTIGNDPNLIGPTDVSHVTICNGDIVTTWGGYANLDERTESAEAFIYEESHPLTRGKYQRGRDRHRLWARLELPSWRARRRLIQKEPL